MLTLQLISLLEQCEDVDILSHVVSLLGSICKKCRTECLDKRVKTKNDFKNMLREKCRHFEVQEELKVLPTAQYYKPHLS